MKSQKGRPEASFHFEDDLALGEWFHSQFAVSCGLETERWAVERVNRVERQLQVKRAPAARLIPEIIWLQEMTAFTAPGRYIYISRELLQRADCDDAIAFVLAHEMAHHDLGHLRVVAERGSFLRRLPAAGNAVLLARAAERFLIGPEAEAAADARALDLSLAAGYDGKRCLKVFDILEAYAIDHRDLDIVFGTDHSLSDSTQAVRRWASQAKNWAWQRVRGYVPIRDRKELLLRRL
jgi:predicted Zn-dependent protease